MVSMEEVLSYAHKLQMDGKLLTLKLEMGLIHMK